MPRGRVKWFSWNKGYGFIEQENDPRDVFVHQTEVSGLHYGEELQDGEEVEFEIVSTPKGLAATNVVRLKQSDVSPTEHISPFA